MIQGGILSLFATMDVRAMDTATVQELISVCEGMMKEKAAEQHWPDYQDLMTRLNSELNTRNAAATKLQSLFRGKMARDEALERRVERQNQAALTIQCAFRMFQAKNTLGALKEQQELQTRQELEKQQALVKADTELTARKVDTKVAALVTPESKLEIARLLEIYEKAEGAAKGKKATHPSSRTARKLEGDLDIYVAQIVHLIEAQLEAEKQILDKARSVTLPPDFRQNGSSVDYGAFLYPGAGELKIGQKVYQLHPNRSLVHARQEIADNATLATAQAYLDSLLKACRTVIENRKTAPVKVISPKIQMNDSTDTGINFYWNVMYTRYDAKSHNLGLSGSIEHIDSGYEQSRWLPTAKRGMCAECGKAKNRHKPH
jgi:hypothetical protein